MYYVLRNSQFGTIGSFGLFGSSGVVRRSSCLHRLCVFLARPRATNGILYYVGRSVDVCSFRVGLVVHSIVFVRVYFGDDFHYVGISYWIWWFVRCCCGPFFVPIQAALCFLGRCFLLPCAFSRGRGVCLGQCKVAIVGREFFSMSRDLGVLYFRFFFSSFDFFRRFV